MHYRRFPRIDGKDISSLGLGLMRLPTIGDDAASINAAELDSMLMTARDLGINYLDTAYIYHKEASEPALGAALKRTGLRENFHIATKCPVWLAQSRTDFDKLLDEQLRRIGVERIDFYLLHALSKDRWEKARDLGVLEAMERAKASGRIGHLGFSFHDKFEVFKQIVDHYPRWEFCQLQYNYIDRDFQAGEAGLAYAAERELGVIVMEPLRGGALARPPRDVRALLERHPVPRTAAEWALRFVLDRQEVVTVLSGMGSSAQIMENAAIADAARANSMLKAERTILEEARTVYKKKVEVPCSACGYCMPCPSGVLIPDIIERYNDALVFENAPGSDIWYRNNLAAAGKGGDSCVGCGACIPKCPQGIPISEVMAKAHKRLAG